MGSIEKNDLLKQKELKINSFTVNVKNPDKKKMSQFDLRFLKELADHPPKSYCEQSDENKKLRNENKDLIAKNDASVQKLEEKQKEIEELLAKVNASVQVSEENEKYKKEMEILKGNDVTAQNAEENKKLKKEPKQVKEKGKSGGQKS